MESAGRGRLGGASTRWDGEGGMGERRRSAREGGRGGLCLSSNSLKQSQEDTPSSFYYHGFLPEPRHS